MKNTPLHKLIAIICGLTVVTALVLQVCFWGLKSPLNAQVADVGELVMALFLSVVMVLLVKRSFLRYVTLGVALALACWSFGEVFTLSFTHLTDQELPFPSVADFGYIGFYLLLSSSLGILKRVDEADVNKGPAPYLVFLLVLVPLAFLGREGNTPLVNVANFVYAFLNALVIYQAVILIRLKLYPWIIGSVVAIGIIGVGLLLAFAFVPAYIHAVTLLFPISFAGLLYGIHQHNGEHA